MSDSGSLECKHGEWLCTRGQCQENVHVKTNVRKQEETNNYGRELADMPSHIFLGQRKGLLTTASSFSLDQKWKYFFQVKRSRTTPQLFHILLFQKE